MNSWFDVQAFQVGAPRRHQFGILFTNITERKLAEAERERLLLQERAARQAAERTNRLKDDFFSALSHELRTPLNPVLGWTKMLQSQRLPADKIAQALETIERNVKHQISLVDDLLNVSRMIQGRLRLKSHPVDLAVTLNNAIETGKFAAQAKAITLNLHTSGPIYTLGDGDRLGQVFWNLVSNAIKFTPVGGQVDIELSVSYRAGSNDAQVRVRDTGIGIAPEFLPHVFEYFRQAEGGASRNYNGLGLGLAIVRHLVELHGGMVTVESPGLGQGSTFTVLLPMLGEPDGSESSTSGIQQITTDNSHSEATTTTSPRYAFEPASNFQGDLVGLTILVVDDEPDNLELLRFLLTQEGATVIASTSALEALQTIAQGPPDLIVSDIGMPEMNGYEFMQRVRDLPSQQSQPTPAIALTAYAQPADQEQAIAAGFQAYFSKPIDPLELVPVIVQLVSLSL